MVGLSVVLEAQKVSVLSDKKKTQVINKATIMLVNNKPSSSTVSPPSYSHHQALPFLDQCFLCRKRLLPGKDIYMYKGDRGFCSVECRCKQIFMDEEESIQREVCSLAAMKSPTSSASPSSSSSSSSPASSRGHRKGPRSRAGGYAC
ncbi:FCS-Like Zinc finger 15-like [Neltuma alba]|uniref:FCS-Like Zinc finger 15-like n=1 Tax=Neltuma alba TaxID=207710 RepID=UPI0010A4A24D|nr:FCS-Like Zinc finger 15-like [Prosopis alba]XP_028789214.1 FCS-Like Zinc finger 15-like [Prosopis alba]